MSPYPVAITGIGLVTPAGLTTEATWSGVLDGKSAAAVDESLLEHPVSLSCRVPDFDPKQHGVARAWQWDRYAQFALAATLAALADAGLDASTREPARVAVIIGSGAGGTTTLEAQTAVLGQDGPGDVSPLTLPMGLLNMAAGQVAIELDAQGPCLAPCTACASGATAIGLGRDLLRNGAADVVVAGAAEAPITALYAAAFARMRALSRSTDPASASRPFDVARDGFVLGEGAGIVVLEREDDARARGADVRARMLGYGASADAHHVTSPHPQGRGARAAMSAALHDAGLVGADIDHVNAHGTSTPMNDKIEGAAIHDVIGTGAAVSSTKGVLGHALGAAGSIEAALAALAVSNGLVPATANLRDPDPALELDLVRDAPRAREVRYALSNSFGFGGQNASLVLAR